MSNFDVTSRSILLVKHGSHAYGTSTPTSDLDVKGVCIPPVEYYLGFAHAFEQQEELASKGFPQDKVVYSIEKFMRLAADCNPNIIEVLHVAEEDVLRIDYFGKKLRQNAHLFLSKKAKHTFSGYAHAQLKRIQTHKGWLMKQDKYECPKPTREEFDLPPLGDGHKSQIEMAFAEVQSKLDSWNIDMRGLDEADKIHLQGRMADLFAAMNMDREGQWNLAAKAVFTSEENLIHRLQRERHYANVVSDWEKYHIWKRTRNVARAELEAKYGYDTKHGGHLIRLMRMCKEILEGKGVIVKRPDAKEILEIRNGSWDYDRLIDEANRLEAECNELYKTSQLPHKPDINKLNELCVDIVHEYHRLHQ